MVTLNKLREWEFQCELSYTETTHNWPKTFSNQVSSYFWPIIIEVLCIKMAVSHIQLFQNKAETWHVNVLSFISIKCAKAQQSMKNRKTVQILMVWTVCILQFWVCMSLCRSAREERKWNHGWRTLNLKRVESNSFHGWNIVKILWVQDTTLLPPVSPKALC